MITVADFRIRYPEFEDVDLYADARIQMFIDDAVIWMKDEHRWLDWYLLAQYCLVGHFLAIANMSETGDAGSAYPVKKQEVDDVLVEHAVAEVKATMDNFHSTIYGQNYYRYLLMTFAGPIGV